MSNVYPAMHAKMGTWSYYVVPMTMRDAAKSITFASKVWEDPTLDKAMQREINKGRAKKEIVAYLSNQEHRFFSAIVVAGRRGSPRWTPLSGNGSPRRAHDPSPGAFGMLRFGSEEKYFVLDGQHRLFAIKELIENRDADSSPVPLGFEDEEIAVIVVDPSGVSTETEIRSRYRRLFSNLNRYAKPTHLFTNIIMDEDDVFAIITRRLITDHRFFQAKVDRQRNSYRVKVKRGKRMDEGDEQFISLEMLYEVNTTLLRSRQRRQKSSDWMPFAKFKRFRPHEEVIEELYAELSRYWDALIEAVPILKGDPLLMRSHQSERSDFAPFWPLGQDILARLARALLDIGESTGEVDPRRGLEPLGRLNWEMHGQPWRNLLLTQNPIKHNWKMRDEHRAAATRMVIEILSAQLGVVDLGTTDWDDLRTRWAGVVFPLSGSKDPRDGRDHMWRQIMAGCLRD